MKTTWTVLMALGPTFLLAAAGADIGTRVAPPSERGHSVESVHESGERGGLLLHVGTNFTAAYNRHMGEAMELWNAHRWGEAAERFRDIRLATPESPWAAEAELHEACFHKFNARYDESEARFVSLLAKYPDNPQIKRKVLHYLPDVYARSGRLAAAMDALQNLRDLPLSWQERQFLENYTRIYARALRGEDEDRLCGTKALALALESQNPQGEKLRNVSLKSLYGKHDWALRKADHPEGYSLDDLAQICKGRPVEVSLEELRAAVQPGHPLLVHLKTPAEPKAFTHLRKSQAAPAKPLTGHFVVVESVGEGVVDLLDPDGGRTRWLLAHFLARWSGIALALPGQTAMNGRALERGQAATLRGGCCGNPPLDPTNECGGDEAGGGAAGGWNGPMMITQSSSGFAGGMAGGNMGGCPTCGGAGGGGSDGGECACGEGAPVYSFGLASANLQLNDIPIWYPAAKGPDMKISLTYNRVATERMAAYSNVNYSMFGHKWHFRYASYLTEVPDTNSTQIMLPGGRVQQFTRNGEDYAPIDVWNKNRLLRTNGSFVLTFHHSEFSWYFSQFTTNQQRLEKIVDRYGNPMTLQYDDASGRLTNMLDAVNRSFRFLYNAQGYVTNVSDSFGRSASFAYSPAGDLVSLTDMGGLTTTIQYDTNHWPTNITYPSQHSWTVDYQHGQDALYLGYDEPFRMAVIDPLGQTNEYFYHAFDYMGPITLRDRAGNNWLYATKAVGETEDVGPAQRTFLNGVNATAAPYSGTSDQWVYRTFDANANPIEIAVANQASLISVGYDDNEGWPTTDVLTTNLFDSQRNLRSSTILTNDPYQYPSLQFFGTWTNWYDNHDNLLGTQNPLNQQTTYGYDAHDHLVAITNALNATTRMAYDSNGNLTNLLDALGRAHRWIYDTNGRLMTRYPPLGFPTYHAYDPIGRLQTTRIPGTLGLCRTNVYDNLDRIIGVVDSYGYTNHFQYGCCGLEMTRDRLGHETHYEHDALGRVSRVTDPLSRLTDFQYNGADQITNLITWVGGQPRAKQFKHVSTNGFSRLTRVVTPMGKSTGYDYTFRGWLASRVDGLGRTNEFQYDALGRLTSVTLSNQPLLSLQYDVLSKVTAVTSDYSAFTYTYDALNRATQVVCLLTNLPGFSNVAYRLDYQYDAVGNLTNRVITGVSGLSGTVTTRYAYDAMNRLTNVVQLTNTAQSATAAYAFNVYGQMYLKTCGNGDTVRQSFDRESRLLSLGITNSGSAVASFGYLWNAGSQIVSITNNGAVTRYAYDAAGQLTNEVTATVTNGWTYDEAGNWLNAAAGSKWVYNADNEIAGRLPTGTPSATNITVTGEVEPEPDTTKWYNTWADCRGSRARVSLSDGTFSLSNVPVDPGHNALRVTVTDVSGNTAAQVRNVAWTNGVTEYFGHDANGNLTNWVSGSQNWAYEWDWADRLTKVSSNGVVLLQNWYDANSRRIAKAELVNGVTKKWLYLYDGWDIVGVMNESGVLQETFTRGLGLAGDIGTLVAVTHHTGANAGTHYTHHNHRGDVVLVRSGTTTTATYEYSAFGTLTTTTGTDLSRFKFSSKERDASCDLSYYGYRFYAPQWQRWVSRDALGETYDGNLFRYVYNDPIGNVDPDGLQPSAPWAPPARPGVRPIEPFPYQGLPITPQGLQNPSPGSRAGWSSLELLHEIVGEVEPPCAVPPRRPICPRGPGGFHCEASYLPNGELYLIRFGFPHYPQPPQPPPNGVKYPFAPSGFPLSRNVPPISITFFR